MKICGGTRIKHARSSAHLALHISFPDAVDKARVDSLMVSADRCIHWIEKLQL